MHAALTERILLVFSFWIAFFIQSFGTIRPDLAALVLAFWVLFFPQHYGVRLAFVIGMLQDLFSDTCMGAHAVMAIVLVYVLSLVRHRFKQWSVIQQMGVLVAVLFPMESFIFFTRHWAIQDIVWWQLGEMMLVTVLCWPIVLKLLYSTVRSIWRAEQSALKRLV